MRLIHPIVLGSVAYAAKPQTTKSKSVIVIGAGMAGVKAARDLTDAGLTVTVLEARDRVGGRIWSDRSFGYANNMGAAWIHGPLPEDYNTPDWDARKNPVNPVTLLARAAGLRTLPTDMENQKHWKNDGSVYTDAEEEEGDAEFSAIEEALEQIGESKESWMNAARPALEKCSNQWNAHFQITNRVEFEIGGSVESAAVGDDSDFTGPTPRLAPA